MKFIGGLLFSILSLVANEVNIAVPSNEMQLAKNPPITLAWLKDKPRTITKDFYISQYFKQEISSHEALEALGQAKNVNNKLFYAFAKKFNHDETYAVAQCMQAKTNNLINQHIDCIEVGLSMYDATKLNYDQLDTLIQRLEPIYETHAKQLKIINATIPFTKLTSSPKDVFFGVFNHCGSVYRGKHFNYPLSRRTLKRLSKDKRFQSSIARIVLNQNLPLMQESLLEINDAKYSHATSFYLALNAIKHKQHLQATWYLESAYKKAHYAFDKDKVRFWQYRLTKEDKYLNDLLNSGDINLYSLLIKEQNNQPLNNIFYALDLSKNSLPSDFDINNAFSWVKLIRQSKKGFSTEQYLDYQEQFNTNDTLPFLAFVTTAYEKYTNNYFITPYSEQFADYTQEQQALHYAIARQESRFIPASISSAQALGVMQIMPFLGKDIAKNLNEDFEVPNLLDVNTSLRYAKIHLDSLQSRLKHPLFTAYAYNGGEGFVNKHIFSEKLFQEGVHEPFMSMEMIPYKETRKYGNKVLANYYIYHNHLNPDNPIKLSNLIQSLILPIPN